MLFLIQQTCTEWPRRAQALAWVGLAESRAGRSTALPLQSPQSSVTGVGGRRGPWGQVFSTLDSVYPKCWEEGHEGGEGGEGGLEGRRACQSPGPHGLGHNSRPSSSAPQVPQSSWLSVLGEFTTKGI